MPGVLLLQLYTAGMIKELAVAALGGAFSKPSASTLLFIILVLWEMSRSANFAEDTGRYKNAYKCALTVLWRIGFEELKFVL